jgi:hypothetical protein
LKACSTASWIACALDVPFVAGGRRRGVWGVVVMRGGPFVGGVPGHPDDRPLL